MSDSSDADFASYRPAEDEHAHVRFFKVLEVAYNSARNRQYGHAAEMAELAAAMYDDMADDIEMEEESQ